MAILRSLDLSIKAGEKIAMVGQSGCGKSTVIQLIQVQMQVGSVVMVVMSSCQRFYDLDSGSLEVEGQDIRGLNVPYVRSKLAIVSQEPVLFNKSIADNIRYDGRAGRGQDDISQVWRQPVGDQHGGRHLRCQEGKHPQLRGGPAPGLRDHGEEMEEGGRALTGV